MITAVDIGATKTLVAQFNDQGEILNEARFPTAKDPRSFVNDLKAELNKLIGISQLVIAVPGIARDGAIVDLSNLPPWEGFHLARELATYNCPVLMQNDANLAGLGEVNLLDPRPSLGMYITVSTGIGSGLVLDGRLLDHLSETEVGHAVFFKDGVWQEWEDFASGRALVDHFGKKAAELSTPEEWQWVAEQLAVGLCALLQPIRPEIVIFGGSVGGHYQQFADPLSKMLNERIKKSDDFKMPKMMAAKHPEEAVIYGCYYYATHQKTT